MKPHIRNLKFRNQIIVTFLAVSLAISTASGMAYYYISERQVTENFFRVSQNAMDQIENTLETRLEGIDHRAKNMLQNSSFGSVMVQYLNRPDSANTVIAQGMISDYLKDFEQGESLVNSSYIVSGRGAFDAFTHVRRRGFRFAESPFYQVYEAKETPLAQQWLGPMDNLIFQDRETVIPCVRRFTLNGYSGWQYFIFQLDQRRLQALLMGKEPFFDDIVILDQEGREIIGGELIGTERLLALFSDTGRGVLQADDRSASYVVESCQIGVNGWRVFGLKSQEEVQSSLNHLRSLIFEVLAGVLAAGVLMIIWIAKHMTEALKRLEKQMICARNGDFGVRFFYPYRDEIGSLSNSFNFMIREIQALIQRQEQMIVDLRQERDNVAKIQKQKRKAELKALQAQINPHFLYNTLNAITWQAMDQGMDDVAQMASSLGKFFRLSLSHGAEIISLSDEIEHVRSYLNIQQIRYQDKLRYEILVPEEFKSVQVPKLVLQPVVENAIYHGIKEKKGAGWIRITARRETGKVIYISVWDDGAGIPREKLEELNQGLSTGERRSKGGYGIYNVNERLRLYYGNEFGITYESVEGEFTRAVLRIPASWQEEEHV